MKATNLPHLIPALKRIIADTDTKPSELLHHLLAFVNVPQVRFATTKESARDLYQHLCKISELSEDGAICWGGAESRANFKKAAPGFQELFQGTLDHSTTRLLLVVVYEAVMVFVSGFFS